MSAHILIVEDDSALLAMLNAALAIGGFTSEPASRGADAVASVRRGGFDAVLLDLGLPDCEGDELLTRLRTLSDLPIIVVSGRGSERDKIEALDLGADDFIAKPFLPGELLARIRAQLRRYAASRGERSGTTAADRQPIRVGALTLDPFDNSATLGGIRVDFTDAEFTVLRALSARQGAIASRADLLSELSGSDAPAESNLVDVYLSRIRARLRALPGGDDLIATVRGQGWRLRPPS